MADLEKIVRPNAAVDVGPPSTHRKTTQINDTPVGIIYGNPSSTVFQLRQVVEIKPSEDREFERTVDIVRVRNPDNPTQFVDTEVMVQYQARNRITDERKKLRFMRPEPTPNTEIIERNLRRTSTDT